MELRSHKDRLRFIIPAVLCLLALTSLRDMGDVDACSWISPAVASIFAFMAGYNFCQYRAACSPNQN